MMDNLVAGALKIEVADAGGKDPILLLWEGRSIDRNPAKFLGPYCASIIAVAAGRGAPIEMHFEKLEYFNSSTITAVIQVIQDAKKHNVKLVILFNPALKWQTISFDTLRALAKGNALLEIRAVGSVS